MKESRLQIHDDILRDLLNWNNSLPRCLRLLIVPIFSRSSTHLPLSTYPVRCLLPLRLESLPSTGITELSTHGVFRSFTFVADVTFRREKLYDRLFVEIPRYVTLLLKQ